MSIKKTIIITILFVTCFLLFFFWALGKAEKHKSTTRTITAKVINVENDNTLLEDTTGNVWSIKDDSYSKGAEVVVTFNTKGTNSILDDEIIKIEKRFNNE